MTKKKEILIVIPARYQSKRLPGKPLIYIEGIPLLERVWNIAKTVQESYPQVRSIVSTEDKRIKSFCDDRKMDCVITSSDCQSGTERVCETLKLLDNNNVDYIINLQGDNALCPHWFVEKLIDCIESKTEKAVFTPFVELSWDELDKLRENKKKTPFSGTTVIYNEKYRALWFSKKIIPTIREESSLRKKADISPVARHIGLYAYHKVLLESIHQFKASKYETLEGLEQLSWLTNNVPIHMVPVSYMGYEGMSGIDSPEDVLRAEKIIRQNNRLSA